MKAWSPKKIFILVTIIFALVTFLFINHLAAAQSPDLGLEYATATGLTTTDIRVVVARIIRYILELLGVIAVCIVVYGGFIWMTSGGEEEKINEAKKIMINGLIGLIIILLAFAIVTWIINALMSALGLSGFDGPNGPGWGRSALGNGIIESHYPPRGAHCFNAPPATEGCIARNTNIIVTFKEPMMLTTFIQDYDDGGSPLDLTDDTINGIPIGGDPAPAKYLKSNNIKIYKSLQTEEEALGDNEVTVRFTDDLKTFVFDPVEYLGSTSERLYYTVKLDQGIEKADGDDAFPTAPNFYSWEFEVGTFLDLTPPTVQSIYPYPSATEPRNVVIQINFNEAIDPTSASGVANVDFDGNLTGFSNILVKNLVNNKLVAGTFTIANQYQTVEFTSDVICGVNSCGNEIYCLPGLANIEVTVKAATLNVTPPDSQNPEAKFGVAGYDGVVDVCANSLNGNGHHYFDDSNNLVGDCKGTDCQGQADPNADHCDCAIGPATDNYWWTFSTSDNIDSTPPRLKTINPGVREGNVELAPPVESLFGKIMMARYLNTTNIKLASEKDDHLNPCPFWIGAANEDTDFDPQQLDDATRVYLYHDPFQDTPINTPPDQIYVYSTHFFANIRDIYQNCYFPTSSDVPACNGNPSCCNGLPSVGNCALPLPL
ncbi:MAG: hypothetical protein WC480_00010 [Patescibacteria group bacterium]